MSRDPWLATRPGCLAHRVAIAVAASLAGFVIARRLGADGVAPTAVRLVVLLSILVVGARRADARIGTRALAAVAAASVAILAIEPWLVADLERRGAAAWADLAPLAGDLVYGPGLAYAAVAIGRSVTRTGARSGPPYRPRAGHRSAPAACASGMRSSRRPASTGSG